MRIADLFLDEQKLEQGHKLYLEDRDGNAIDEWISILFVHSDAAQRAMASAMRADFEAGELNKEDTGNETSLLRRYAWTLITDWSFEDECTPENVKLLFSRSPDIRMQVIYLAERKRLFFPAPETSSSGGSKKKSNS